MENTKQQAKKFLHDFKKEDYTFGLEVFDRLGEEVAKLGKRVSIIVDGLGQDWISPLVRRTEETLMASGLTPVGEYISGARPNAPREDVFFIVEKISEQNPDVVLSIGGGSTTDAVKAAIALNGLRDKYPDINAYFGTAEVSKMLLSENRKLLPHYAVMTVAGSAAHLTKYSNITDLCSGQKMLIVDEAIVPAGAMFDYTFTTTQPHSLTIDGALDGISHGIEVLMGIPEDRLEKAKPICLTAIELIVNSIKKAVTDPGDIIARESIGLGTDLGGYAIMIGGTNGAHLNSFSMTDILSHGRACALMNPYYVVFFSPNIENRLRDVGSIYKKAGYIRKDLDVLHGSDLGLAVAEGMISLSEDIGFPTTLKSVPGYTETHKRRCLEAAKDPKLESKRKNMPIPMSTADVDKYMKSVLDAAESGDMGKIIKIEKKFV
jgi:alcohol dehydrogenase class IV